MRETNVAIIRGHLLRKLDAVRLYISMLPDPEPQAYSALANPNTVCEMLDFILAKMGHVPRNGAAARPLDHAKAPERLSAVRKRMAPGVTEEV